MELDVNTTSDGMLFATHDAIVDGLGWITEQMYDGLVAADPDTSNSRRLEEVVGHALAQQVGVYLDLKSITPTTGLKHIVATGPPEVDDRRIILASDRGDIVSWIGDNLPSAVIRSGS